MLKVIEAIEEKLNQQDTAIFCKNAEICNLKRKLEEAEKIIADQAKTIEEQAAILNGTQRGVEFI